MEKKPNDQFREAREHTESPAHPDECLSRQEVADQANAWIWNTTQRSRSFPPRGREAG